MSDTPRTDAVQNERRNDTWDHYAAMRDHARQLERENAELRGRYEWLADKVIAPDYGDNDSNPHRKGYFIRHCKGPSWIPGDTLDAAIDEARALEAK